MERARQQTENGNLEKEKLIQILKKHEMDQQEQINLLQNDDVKKKKNLITIQKFIRGFFERKKFFIQRKNEAYFLEINHNLDIHQQNKEKINSYLKERK